MSLDILIDGNGMLKLADFGSAKVLARQVATVAVKTRTVPFMQEDGTPMVAQNTLSGTPVYMSPEGELFAFARHI